MHLPFVLILAMALLLIGSVYAGAEFRTFTSEDGSEIRAKILRADQNHVWIQRDDGRTFQVPLIRLSEENRAEIQEWRRGKGAFPPDAFRFSTSRFVEGAQDTSYEAVSLIRTDGTRRVDERGIQHIRRLTGYTVTVESRRSEAVEGLHAEYMIFTSGPQNQLRVAAGGKEDLGTLPPFGKTDFKTSAVTVSRTTHRHSKEPSRNPRTELGGVWVRIYQGDILVAEFSMPASLSANEEWRKPVISHWQGVAPG